MIWHLFAVLGAVGFALWLLALVVLVALYRRSGGAQVMRDIQTAKRMTAEAGRAAAP